jgi:O-antigen ligase
MDSVQVVKQEAAATPVRPAESAGRSSGPVKRVTMGHLLGLVLAVVVVLAIAVLMGILIWSPNWSSAVTIVGLGAVVAMIFVSPINGLILWIILEPYARFWYLNIPMPSGIPDLSLSRLSVAFLSVVWLAQLATKRRRIRRFGLIEIWMVLFGILVIPSVAAGTGGMSRSLQTLFDKFFAPYLVFVLAKNLYDEKTGLDRLIALMAVLETYLLFVLFYEHVTGVPLFYIVGRTLQYTRSLRKIVGLLGNATFLATILAMIAPFALYKLTHTRSSYARAFYAGMFGLAVFGNFICYNRGAWLAMAVSLFVALLLEVRYRRILVPLLLIAVILVAVYWIQVTSSPVVTERLSNVTSIRFRLNMLEVSERMIRANPLFGVGFESFSTYYIQYGGHWELMAWDQPMPHNTYVFILATMGLAAFVPYLLVFLSLFAETGVMMRSHWRKRGADHALLVSVWAAVAAYMASAAFIDIYPNAFTSLVLFFIMGTMVGYVSQIRASWRASGRPADLPRPRTERGMEYRPRTERGMEYRPRTERGMEYRPRTERGMEYRPAVVPVEQV